VCRGDGRRQLATPAHSIRLNLAAAASARPLFFFFLFLLLERLTPPNLSISREVLPVQADSPVDHASAGNLSLRQSSGNPVSMRRHNSGSRILYGAMA